MLWLSNWWTHMLEVGIAPTLGYGVARDALGVGQARLVMTGLLAIIALSQFEWRRRVKRSPLG